MDVPILELRDLRYGFVDRPDFLGPISGVMLPGKVHGLIGPNGAGKSTLVRLCVGINRPSSGLVLLHGRSLHEWSALDRSKNIAYVPQRVFTPPGLTVRETVLMGRFPHRGRSWFETQQDWQMADDSMRMMEVEDFADRMLGTLSGGEAQCVHLAAAVAQQTELLVLDEPTSALDLYHQHLIYEKLTELAHQRDWCVVVVTHDLNLANQYCDELWVMKSGQLLGAGPPSRIMDAELLLQTYQVRVELLRTARADLSWVASIGRAEDSANAKSTIKRS